MIFLLCKGNFKGTKLETIVGQLKYFEKNFEDWNVLSDYEP